MYHGEADKNQSPSEYYGEEDGAEEIWSLQLYFVLLYFFFTNNVFTTIHLAI